MPTLDWIGKKAVVNHHRQVPYRLLRCDESLSVGDPNAGNLLVQGDNLEALKALLPYYAGQVKCIYIDPPYNTGNEGWVYNDNVNSPDIRKWLNNVVGGEAEDLSRHDKWLCMMYPRMALLREFLREDGAIFVSIDDNEVHHLRILMDEIFGPNNFVATIIWQKKYASSNDHTGIAPMHDYIVAFRRSERFRRRLIQRTGKKDRQYRFQDDQGIFRISDYTCNKTADERPNLYYSITQPNTGEEIWPKRTRVWAYSQDLYKKHEAEELVYWGKEGKSNVPSFKRYRHRLKRGEGIVPNTWWDFEFAGHTDQAKKEIRAFNIDDNALDFITPKPVQLVKRVLEVAADKDSIILDAFAGSGTTGHAVLDLNAQDGGSRKFILIEVEPEICRNIAGRRIELAIRGYTNDRGESVDGLDGGVRFCTLYEPLFDEHGRISGPVTYADLAAHVFFTEAGVPLPSRFEGSPLLGVHSGRAVYLLFNGVLGDRRPQGGNVLTNAVLAHLPRHDGPKVIYGEGKRLSEERLRREGIVFKQIPYGIAVT